MESGEILDEHITASSVFSGDYPTRQSRLHSSRGWAPSTPDTDDWLQIKFGSPNTNVIGVATQGDSRDAQWVTEYALQHGNDTSNFLYYQEQGDDERKVSSTNNISQLTMVIGLSEVQSTINEKTGPSVAFWVDRFIGLKFAVFVWESLMASNFHKT